MVTIKSFTDLNQAKVLSKILPLESADMVWEYQKDRFVGEPDYLDNPQFGYVIDKRDIACWSLAALLGVLQYPTLFQNGDKEWGCTVWIDTTIPYSILPKENPVDACYELILKLHELNLL